MPSFQQFVEAKKQSEFAILKQNKKPLENEEKDKAMKAGCVWHFTNKPSCAIYKSKDTKGQEWYCSNTHRAYDKSKTLDQAIKNWHKTIEPSS